MPLFTVEQITMLFCDIYYLMYHSPNVMCNRTKN